MHFRSNVLRYMFGEDDKALLRPNRSPHPQPFYSSSSSRPPGPCRRVASAIIHHPVLFGTSDKFRECWCNYIKHKSVITSLYMIAMKSAQLMHVLVYLPFACQFAFIASSSKRAERRKIVSIIITP